MAGKKNCWSKMIEESGVRVRLYARPSGRLYRSVTVDGKKDRKSLGHSDRKLGEEQARALARAIAEMRLTGVPAGHVTLGQVFELYRRHKLPQLREKYRSAAERRIGLFEEAWGRQVLIADISQTRVDSYHARRRSGELSPLEGDPSSEKKRRVRDGTIAADLRWLSSVFNWARRHKVGGRRVIRENPLHDCSWPKEKNPRRPVASHQRYLRTQEKTGQVDEHGRLRCMLALARYTGRREGAITKLRASDVLLSQDVIQQKLAAVGMDERLAKHMPHGAIHWSAETDKVGIMHVTPISKPAREELELYLRRRSSVGDVPLFPADEDPGESIRTDVASRWLLEAERMAKLPKLEQGLWHPYRRLWATERKNLPDVDVAAAGGWKDTTALKLSYQRSDPDTLLKVVEAGG